MREDTEAVSVGEPDAALAAEYDAVPAEDPRAPRPAPPAAARAGAPIRVLVADDQPLERAGNALILDSDDDLEVVAEAANGVEAVALAGRYRPDIVLMDVRMPVMGGLEATRIIAEAHPRTRIIVLTTFDLDEYAFGSLQAGASAFLLKSTKPAALVEAVKTVASGAAVAAPRLTAKLIEHYLARSPDAALARGEQEEREPARVTTGARIIDGSGPLVERSRVAEQSRLDVLSPRERDVFVCVVRGLTNTEISAELTLAPSTVKSHINSTFAKLGLRDRVHAVILGYELGLAPGE